MRLTTTAELDAPEASQQEPAPQLTPTSESAPCPFDVPGEGEAADATASGTLPLPTPEKLAAIPLDDLRRLVGEANAMLAGNDTLGKKALLAEADRPKLDPTQRRDGGAEFPG